MSTNPEEAQVGFSRNYLRLWRLTKSNEWRIAVEVLRPLVVDHDLSLAIIPDLSSPVS